MSVSRRQMLQSSLLCAVGMVHGSSPALAQELTSPPTPDERKRLARLAAAFMDTYDVPGLSVAIATKGKPAYVEAFGVADRARGGHGRDLEPVQTDPGSAKTALDRIVIPQDALDHIAGMTPRSSLIITDEALSSETGNGTDFVIILSGEPQGGIKIRRRSPGTEFRCGRPRDRLPYWRSPFAGPFSSW